MAETKTLQPGYWVALTLKADHAPLRDGEVFAALEDPGHDAGPRPRARGRASDGAVSEAEDRVAREDRRRGRHHRHHEEKDA